MINPGRCKFPTYSPDCYDDALAIFNSLQKTVDADALFITGKCYQEGLVVERNAGLAQYYFYNAALQGSKDANTALNAILSSG
jgi:TPR repeat protein